MIACHLIYLDAVPSQACSESSQAVCRFATKSPRVAKVWSNCLPSPATHQHISGVPLKLQCACKIGYRHSPYKMIPLFLASTLTCSNCQHGVIHTVISRIRLHMLCGKQPIASLPKPVALDESYTANPNALHRPWIPRRHHLWRVTRLTGMCMSWNPDQPDPYRYGRMNITFRTGTPQLEENIR